MSSHYDNPLVISYSFGSVDFGAGTIAEAIRKPAGKSRFRVEEIHIAVSETFASDQTTAKVRLGTSGDADRYAELIIPDGTADTDGFGLSDDSDALKSTSGIGPGMGDLSSLQDDIDQIEVTTVQAADAGTAAGIGLLTIVLAWW